MGLPLYNPPVVSDILPRKQAGPERRPAVARSRIRGSNTNPGRPRRPENQTARQLQNIRHRALHQQLGRRHPSLPPFPLPNAVRDGTNNAGVREVPGADASLASLWNQRDANTVKLELVELHDSIFSTHRGDELSLLARIPSDRPGEVPLRGIRFHSRQTRAERMAAVTNFAMQPFVQRNIGLLSRLEVRLRSQCWRVAAGVESVIEDYETAFQNARLGLFPADMPSADGAGPDDDTTLQNTRQPFPPEIRGSLMDGLGDRSRSLSPEHYDVWETLLTTVTPDPQPPSISSSFTSASASAVASQSTASASSATSFTNPDIAEEAVWHEPGCESENGDTDLDEDELVGLVWSAGRFPGAMSSSEESDPEPPGRRSYREGLRYRVEELQSRIEQARANGQVEDLRRSYEEMVRERLEVARELNDATRERAETQEALVRARADEAAEEVVAEVPDSVFGMVGGVGGMQNIIRNLARRQDIPNSWWAEAGLSRNIPGFDASD